jgi:hypothetical protein
MKLPPPIKALHDLLAERGFQLTQDTCTSSKGQPVPMYRITREDTPQWKGAWMPWLEHSSSEAQTVLSLTCEALHKWRNFTHQHEPKADKVSIISGFVESVERRAEEKMLKTGKLEGAHYAAMRQIFEEYKQN